MGNIKNSANSASGMMWKTLSMVLLHYFYVKEESNILCEFLPSLYSLCLDFMSMLKMVFLLIKGKIKVVTNSYEFLPLMYSCGNESAEILLGTALTSWYSVLVPG